LTTPVAPEHRLAVYFLHRADPSEAFPAGYLYYMGGKKYAELAAWDVQKESGNKWPLATINCVMIFGPSSEAPSLLPWSPG